MDFVLELAQLMKSLPRLALPMLDCENSPYNSFLYKSRNCYLCFSSSSLDSCFYCDICNESADSMDSNYLMHSELCYECIDCEHCYNCNSSQDCKNCADCAFCYDCHGCRNCFGCVGLRKKEYHIFNKQYSKEDYEKKLNAEKKHSKTEIERKVNLLRMQFPHPAGHIYKSEHVTGDYVTDSKNCYMCFQVEDAEDGAYLYEEIYHVKDSVDCTHIHNCQYCYNCMSSDNCYNLLSSWIMVNCRDCSYCYWNTGCSDCLGCVNVQRKQYHILNKPYSKDEYFKAQRQIEDDLRNRKLHGKFLVGDALELGNL